MQRHALSLDELTDESIEQDLPVQKVALATPADVPQAEHDRLVQKGADITQKATAAYGELAATKGGDNKTLRHLGKSFQRGVLTAPSPIVEVRANLLPPARQAELAAAGPDSRWFWWDMANGEDYRIKHRNWGGGFATQNRISGGGIIDGIGIRDLAADSRPLLKRVLLHEGVHQIQWENTARHVSTPESDYRKEFEAYWVSGEFANIRDATRRAAAIRTHIVGAGPTDTNTVYIEIRDWYHTQATALEQAAIDAIRIGNVGGLAWWQMNIHIKRLLGELRTGGTDDERLAEWKKLDRSEKRRALADPALAAKIKRTVSITGSAWGRAVGVV
ncbi:MAG: hypothetical protein ACRDZ7_18665 [Acidimicrobiia bacterium]